MNKFEVSKSSGSHSNLSPSAAQQQAGGSQSLNQQKQQKQPPQQQPGNQPKAESQVKQSDSQLNQSNAQKIPQPNQAQQQQASTTTETIKAKWHQQVGAAKVLWGKLTDDEILQSEGNAEKLSGLVKERYAINREEAQKQVKKFLAECKC
jgi:uncharacterized protein YjbJ (UPF0337 family)